MASATTSSPDVMVTLKVNYQGLTRRCKLPLRDMGASTLEHQVRAFLSTPPGAELLLERYSDSAAAYVTLHPDNISVYKQLYRAAKAKQKLKLRVTNLTPLKEVEKEEKPVPRPVTVEDVPETAAMEAEPARAESLPETAVETAAEKAQADLADLLRFCSVADSKDDTKKILPSPHTGLDFETSLLASLMKRQAKSEEELAKTEASSSHVPVVEGTPARAKWFAEASRQDSVGSHLGWPSCPRDRPLMGFAICCNNCEMTIPEAHYHCSTCDDGDYDLCQACVDSGVTCNGDDHWLIKRVVKNGKLVNSTTETIAPKPKVKKTEPAPVNSAPSTRYEPAMRLMYNLRTCNNCVQEFSEDKFLHCTSCEDFDLCESCFQWNSHGHTPKHAFAPASEGAVFPSHITAKLAPGRNQPHNAVCDGCDKYVYGVRHKCLDCPDWDYCSDCVVNASFVHPNHRFVPVYDPLEDPRARSYSRAVHFGVCCDGPLCARSQGPPSFIKGIRYKCTVCHDTDFCANCEASPANTHNHTHPLVKFKTPVRCVTVTTTGERGDGKRLPQMGDRASRRTSSRSTETTQSVTINAPQTVVDVKPSEPVVKQEVVEPEVKEEATSPEPKVGEEEVKVEEPVTPIQNKIVNEDDLVAVYLRDTVADGTVFPPNHVFEQTWVLRNQGEVAWPAGCSVKFVGGDYMGHVDSSHPAGISELVSASESTVCYESLAPGEEFPFTVLLRTPSREGKIISYWRLTTNDGMKFGHRLWCDVNVQAPKPVVKEPKEDEIPETQRSSQMIFPKLEKESPMASVHEDTISEATPALPDVAAETEEYEDCVEDEDWDASDDGFMTDEEYDILDASDEEYLEEQQKKVAKK